MKNHRNQIIACAALALGVGLTHRAEGQMVVTFVGSLTAPWSVASNWNPAVVPANNGPNTFNVVIPSGKYVSFSIPTVMISNLSGATGGSLQMLTGKLQVLEQNDFHGFLDMNGGTFTAMNPAFGVPDNASFHIKGGKATLYGKSYTRTVDYGNMYMFAVNSGVLDLSSVETFTHLPAGSSGDVVAKDSGVVDLSGLKTLTGPTSGQLDFLADLGEIRFGDVSVQGKVVMVTSGFSSSKLVFGGLALHGPATIGLSKSNFGFGHASVAHDLSYDTKVEANVQLLGRVLLNGARTIADPQIIEVGGTDIGLPVGTLPANFQMGQLAVGTATQATYARLEDLINNGNRTGGVKPEALYLEGLLTSDFDGLRIGPGSTLDLGEVEAYAKIANGWIRLRDLIPVGQSCVPFDQGMLCAGTSSVCVPDCDASATLNIDDFICFQTLYAVGDPKADCDTSGTLNIDDFVCFQAAYAIGC